jgi:mannose-6-phosphate isomerase-like protein (cupin superfamily)
MSHAETSGVAVTVYTAGIDTGGTWSLVDITLARYTCGLPLHVHAHTTERLTVLEGLLVCTLGTRTITLGYGDRIDVPLGVAHTCFNPTAAPARLRLWRAPVPPDQQRADLAALTALAWQTIVRDPADQARLMQAYDQQADEGEAPAVARQHPPEPAR